MALVVFTVAMCQVLCRTTRFTLNKPRSQCFLVDFDLVSLDRDESGPPIRRKKSVVLQFVFVRGVL